MGTLSIFTSGCMYFDAMPLMMSARNMKEDFVQVNSLYKSKKQL